MEQEAMEAGYRELKVGEVIQDTDEVWMYGVGPWERADWSLGERYQTGGCEHWRMRRKVADAPSQPTRIRVSYGIHHAVVEVTNAEVLQAVSPDSFTADRLSMLFAAVLKRAALEVPPRAPVPEFLSEESARRIEAPEDGEPCTVNPDGSVTRGASLGDPLKPAPFAEKPLPGFAREYLEENFSSLMIPSGPLDQGSEPLPKKVGERKPLTEPRECWVRWNIERGFVYEVANDEPPEKHMTGIGWKWVRMVEAPESGPPLPPSSEGSPSQGNPNDTQGAAKP